MSNIQKSNPQAGAISLKDKLNKLTVSSKGKDSALAKVELPRIFYQLVIFVLDGSQSMEWEGKTGKSKGEEVHEMIVPIIERLNKSKNRNCFDISAWSYSEDFVQFLPVTNVTKLSYISFNPTHHVRPYRTFVSSTLESVNDQALSYLKSNADKNAKVLIVLLSDGAFHDTTDAIKVADEIKSNPSITISTAFLETIGEDEREIEACGEIMQQMANGNGLDNDFYFMSSVDPDVIRKHMIKSISTVSKID